MHFRFILTLIIVQFSSVVAYFEYSDCLSDCKQRMWSCTIEETSSRHFSWECFERRAACEFRASSYVVSLMPGAKAIGGKSIWDDFQHRNGTTTQRPTTTSTTLRPRPRGRYTTLVVSILLTVLFGVVAVCVVCIKYYSRRREYQPINSRSTDVYQSTTEDINQA